MKVKKIIVGKPRKKHPKFKTEKERIAWRARQIAEWRKNNSYKLIESNRKSSKKYYRRKRAEAGFVVKTRGPYKTRLNPNPVPLPAEPSVQPPVQPSAPPDLAARLDALENEIRSIGEERKEIMETLNDVLADNKRLTQLIKWGPASTHDLHTRKSNNG